MLMVKNAIDSKMAFLTKEGKIYTIGNFIEDEGILYSNASYQKRTLPYRDLGAWNWNCYSGGWSNDAPFEDDWWNSADCVDDAEALMWLDEGDYVKTANGTLIEGYDYLIDATGRVYEYDYKLDAAIAVSDMTAYNCEGMPKQFDYELSDLTPVTSGSITYGDYLK